MKSHLLTEDIVDLTCYPIPHPTFANYDESVFKKRQLTIPDLHGNALKNVWVLIYYGVLLLQAKEYQALVSLYFTPIERWGDTEIDKLRNILNQVKVNEKAEHNILIRYIGDETGDRGVLDFINLLIFKKLHDAHIDFTIIVSNHGMEIIYCLEKKSDFNCIRAKDLPRDGTFVPILPPAFRESLTNMQRLIDAGKIKREEIVKIINECYLPHLKVVDYSVNPITQRPTVYTHAGSGDNTLVGLDQQLSDLIDTFSLNQKEIQQLNALSTVKLSKQPSTKERALFIDKMNIKFTIIKHRKMIHQLYRDDTPFVELVWNRDQSKLMRDPNCDYCNGHNERDPNLPSASNVYEIDCVIGKSLAINKGVYLLLNSNDLSSEEYNG